MSWQTAATSKDMAAAAATDEGFPSAVAWDAAFSHVEQRKEESNRLAAARLAEDARGQAAAEEARKQQLEEEEGRAQWLSSRAAERRRQCEQERLQDEEAKRKQLQDQTELAASQALSRQARQANINAEYQAQQRLRAAAAEEERQQARMDDSAPALAASQDAAQGRRLHEQALLRIEEERMRQEAAQRQEEFRQREQQAEAELEAGVAARAREAAQQERRREEEIDKESARRLEEDRQGREQAELQEWVRVEAESRSDFQSLAGDDEVDWGAVSWVDVDAERASAWSENAASSGEAGVPTPAASRGRMRLQGLPTRILVDRHGDRYILGSISETTEKLAFLFDIRIKLLEKHERDVVKHHGVEYLPSALQKIAWQTLRQKFEAERPDLLRKAAQITGDNRQAFHRTVLRFFTTTMFNWYGGMIWARAVLATGAEPTADPVDGPRLSARAVAASQGGEPGPVVGVKHKISEAKKARTRAKALVSQADVAATTCSGGADNAWVAYSRFSVA